MPHGDWVRVDLDVGLRLRRYFLNHQTLIDTFDSPRLSDADGKPDLAAIAHFERTLWSRTSIPEGARIVSIRTAHDRWGVSIVMQHSDFELKAAWDEIPEVDPEIHAWRPT